MGRLDGKVALVTGASRGIGRAIATLFAAEGAVVVCAARTLREGDHRLAGSLESTAAEIAAAGGEAAAIACDVSEEPECRRLVDEVLGRYGRLDVLVNNAALTYYTPIVELAPNRWMRAFAVNVHGPFFLAHHALPDMIQRRSGAIVNVSSAAAAGPGRGPYADQPRGNTMYGASKAALERFTQGLAQEVYPHGVSVSCVSPSQIVATPGTAYHDLVRGPDDPGGEPPEYMARAVLLLATEPCERVSGRVCYSQALLEEHGLLAEAHGAGVDRPGSGYSRA